MGQNIFKSWEVVEVMKTQQCQGWPPYLTGGSLKAEIALVLQLQREGHLLVELVTIYEFQLFHFYSHFQKMPMILLCIYVWASHIHKYIVVNKVVENNNSIYILINNTYLCAFIQCHWHVIAFWQAALFFSVFVATNLFLLFLVWQPESKISTWLSPSVTVSLFQLHNKKYMSLYNGTKNFSVPKEWIRFDTLKKSNNKYYFLIFITTVTEKDRSILLVISSCY